MSNALIYIAIAVAVVAMAGAIAYGTENQKIMFQKTQFYLKQPNKVYCQKQEY